MQKKVSLAFSSVVSKQIHQYNPCKLYIAIKVPTLTHDFFYPPLPDIQGFICNTTKFSSFLPPPINLAKKIKFLSKKKKILITCPACVKPDMGNCTGNLKDYFNSSSRTIYSRYQRQYYYQQSHLGTVVTPPKVPAYDFEIIKPRQQTCRSFPFLFWKAATLKKKKVP